MFRIKFFMIYTVLICSTASANNTIDIAAIYALTGAAAEDNAGMIQGVRYGVNEINESGGVLDMKINLLVFDNLSTPLGSSIAVERAAEAGVAAIIGPGWSSHAIPVARVAQAGNIPMITDTATHPEVTKIGNYIFRVCFIDNFQGSLMAKFALRDMKAATAGLFTDVTSDYSLNLSGIFRKNFEKAGGRILFEAQYKHKQEKFDVQIQQAMKPVADVLFLSGHHETGFIAKQIRDAGIASVPLGGDGWGGQPFFSGGGLEMRRGYYCTHWSQQKDSRISRSFGKKYKNMGNLISSTALAYDAVMLLTDAIRRADTTNKTKIREAIADTHDFQGVTGTISFDENGDPVKNAVIMEIKDGKPHYFKEISP